MQVSKVSSCADGVFSLSGDLDRNNVNGIWASSVEDIKQAAKKQPVVLDLKQTTHVDTTGLAWLINLLRDCQAQNTQFTLRNTPKTLINLAKISDVDGFLPLQ